MEKNILTKLGMSERSRRKSDKVQFDLCFTTILKLAEMMRPYKLIVLSGV